MAFDQKAYRKKYYEEHKEQEKLYSRNYRADNPEQIAEYKKKYRAGAGGDVISLNDKEYKQNNKEKVKAHKIVKMAVHKGELIRPENCSICGSIGNIQGHHNDYNKPLDVVWVCPRCHAKLDQERRHLESIAL